MPLGVEVDLSPGHFVLDWTQPPPLKGHSRQFSANVRCGQTAGWTKMPLGMEVGLGPATLCSMVIQLAPEKRHTHPTQFLAHVY